MKHDAPAEFLEGTTYAGKTTIGVIKFVMKCLASPKKIHILSGLDLGTIEKNMIVKDFGLLEVFGDHIEYNPSGRGKISLPHLAIKDKIILVLGYDNKTRWKKALGGQYGCLYIDEINIADMEYVREASMRCDYLMATLNPDDPDLEVYKEYINRSRPLPEWSRETPEQILEMLTEPEVEGWTHWFFHFNDNAGATPDKVEQIMSNLAPGTKIWKNKIQGIRGRHTGLVFDLDEKRSVISERDLFYENGQLKLSFQYLSCGIDTSYSRKSDDKIAMVVTGITHEGLKYTLANIEFNNTERVRNGQMPLAPSDLPPLIVSWLSEVGDKYGFIRDVYIDSADQATLTECEKYRRQNGILHNFISAFKKTKIIDRITLQQGWLSPNKNCSFIVDTCKPLIREMNIYSWKEDKQEPEDANDHSINADQYSWLPYKLTIGRK